MIKYAQIAETHKGEVRSALSQIANLSCRATPRKCHPSRYSPFIWSWATGKPVNDWCKCREGIAHSIRQIHDFYGWMAKYGKRGLCKGTLYRTVEFMDIGVEHRDGTTGPTRNIHIEHTVPVAVLQKFLNYDRNRYNTPEELHWALLSNSICVAMTHDEQKALDICKVARSSNPAYSNAGERIGDRPFLRYESLFDSSRGRRFKIVNVVTGKLIDIHSETFEDHESTLATASKLVNDGHSNSFNVYSLNLFDHGTWRVGS